jgi:hypothetical protein
LSLELDTLCRLAFELLLLIELNFRTESFESLRGVIDFTDPLGRSFEMLLALLLLLLLRTFWMDAGWGEGDNPLFWLDLSGGVRALSGGFGKFGLRSEFSDFVVRRFSYVLSTFDPVPSFLMLSREGLRVRGWMLSLREPIVGVSGR